MCCSVSAPLLPPPVSLLLAVIMKAHLAPECICEMGVRWVFCVLCETMTTVVVVEMLAGAA